MDVEKTVQDETGGQVSARDWLVRYETALAAIAADPVATLDNLLLAIWLEGILGRISPINPIERALRLAEKRQVWEGRDDPELYWRLLYSCGHVRHALEANWTTADGPIANAAILGVFRMAARKVPLVLPNGGGVDVDLFPLILGDFERRARQGLILLGAAPHDPLIPIGAVGNFEGVDVKVDCYHGDGLVWLKGTTQAEHFRLYDRTRGRGVSPSRLDIEAFTFDAQASK